MAIIMSERKVQSPDYNGITLHYVGGGGGGALPTSSNSFELFPLPC